METKSLLREAILTLLNEVYEGPPDPRMTWVTSNVADSGVLGTTKSLTAAQAGAKPAGVAHSIAEHVAHLRFAVETGLAYARGEDPHPDWKQSWITGELDEAGWTSLQNSLRESVEKMKEFVREQEQFAILPSVCGFTGTVAHAAYHLGAIRTLDGIVRNTKI